MILLAMKNKHHITPKFDCFTMALQEADFLSKESQTDISIVWDGKHFEVIGSDCQCNDTLIERIKYTPKNNKN